MTKKPRVNLDPHHLELIASLITNKLAAQVPKDGDGLDALTRLNYRTTADFVRSLKDPTKLAEALKPGQVSS